jgi:hypothetical protein
MVIGTDSIWAVVGGCLKKKNCGFCRSVAVGHKSVLDRYKQVGFGLEWHKRLSGRCGRQYVKFKC